MRTPAQRQKWTFPSEYIPRVVLKLRKDAGSPLPTRGLIEPELERRGLPLQKLKVQFSGIGLMGRVYVQPDAELQSLREKVKERFGIAPEYESYVSFLCLNGAKELVATFNEGFGQVIERAFIESPPAPPPGIAMPGWPYAGQIYLQPAPGGVDALSMWDRDAAGNVNGDTGAGVTLFHIDESWDLLHPELPAGIPLDGYNFPGSDHGTLVLGMLAAQDRQSGCRGIAYDATFRAVSSWRLDAQGVFYLSRSEAIRAARLAGGPGDVILFEAQTEDGTPSECDAYDELIHLEIMSATVSELMVVEPVGDPPSGKSVNLDKVMKRPDSGALLVAGAQSVGGEWTSLGTTGKRIHCFASGTAVATIDPGDPKGTSQIAETSGASAIIAGAATLAQAWSKRVTGDPLDPDELRAILSDPALNTLPAKGEVIGVMPDLSRIHAHLLARI